MNEWDVYIEGQYCGTVHASTEEEARLAAMTTYEHNDPDTFSVFNRSR